MKSFVIVFSFIVAMLLAILPLPSWLIWLWPEWVALMLIFWVSAMPDRVGLVAAFIIGLFLDLLYGTLLGEYALVSVVIAYCVIKFYPRVQLFPVWQQSVMVFILMLFCQGIKFLLQAVQGQYPGTLLYWLPALTSAMLWPWINGLFKKYRNQRRLYL